MSADNYLVSIPAADGKYALYMGWMSDNRIDLGAPHHLLCKQVVSHGKLLGVYETTEQLEQAAENELDGNYVEYGYYAHHEKEKSNGYQEQA